MKKKERQTNIEEEEKKTRNRRSIFVSQRSVYHSRVTESVLDSDWFALSNIYTYTCVYIYILKREKKSLRLSLNRVCQSKRSMQ